jgi:hypothetical protein
MQARIFHRTIWKGRRDLVKAWLYVRVMVNAATTSTETTDVVNGFSDLILSLYGSEIGMHARSAIGVQTLPLDIRSQIKPR